MSAQKPPETSETRVAVARVYSALRTPIVDGDIPPGTRIKIDTIAHDLGVSQTPVREALQRLESDDLLVYTPGRGYRTTPILDFTGLRSLFEFRLLVEPWAARSVATDRLANPGDALEKELKEFKRIAVDGGDVRQKMLAHDAKFHEMILAAAGNDVVWQAFTQTHCHLHIFRLFPVDFDGAITIVEHQKVLEAIRDCDPDEAEQAMADHVRNSFERSAQAFDKPGQSAEALDHDASRRTRVIR